MRATFIPLIVALATAACSANEMPVAPDNAGGRPELGPPPPGTNNAPTVAITAPAPATGTVGLPVTVIAAFTDQDAADTHTCSLDWQLATTSGTVAENAGTGTCTGSFVYQTAGQYKVIAAVIDNAGGTGMDSITVNVVVTPPPPPSTSGRLFGEGRLAQPTASANTHEGAPFFAVAARYSKEQKRLRAEFEFAAPKTTFRFRATSADLFTVTGGLAELRGTGRFKEHGNASFLVRALDGKRAGTGQTDRIRIKIWNAGGVLFDSDPGSPESANPATPVERGGIVIRP